MVTKLVANRLRIHMAELVSPNQVSFVPGRHIQDNIVIAQELVHSMSRLQDDKKFMSIKIDLEKACDRLSWTFIADTLIKASLPPNLRRVIMECMTTPRMQVLWNDSPTDSFAMDHGIPIIHRRVNKEHFRHIVYRVHSRLAGWSMNTLSMAGRVTLAQSVFQAIPTYLMHIVKLPISICSMMDKACRNFIRGHSEERRIIHLDLRGKYLNRIEGTQFHKNSTDSWLWKAITRAWDQVSKGAMWAVGRGDRVRFWEDV
ncbi:hypothetical protein CRG98_004033 [Punica granatum]|uniref:Uncharacterized protein n=1 Tax=Punica granatum TaxID=22663 RepID=A0A2I0L4K9_PUNGR|nr:hypothetical protein CRG98_004033 [Punica granatum]